MFIVWKQRVKTASLNCEKKLLNDRQLDLVTKGFTSTGYHKAFQIYIIYYLQYK